MTEKLECFECGHLVVPAIAERLETLPVRGEPVEVLSRVGVCPDCGADMSVPELDDATLVAAFNTYRSNHGLITPEEMRRLRARYGLGQRPFSLLLGWGEISLHRYEGGSLQDSAHNAQLKMAEDPANVRILLEANGHKLTARQRERLVMHLQALERSAELGRAATGLVAREARAGYAPIATTRTVPDDIDRRALLKLPPAQRRAYLKAQADAHAAEYSTLIDHEWLDADLGEWDHDDE